MLKRKYELVYLVAPDTPEETQTEIAERMKSYIEQMNGTLESLELWEKRQLAYEIRKYREAFYYIIKFEGDGTLVDELEKRMRVADEVLRFLTIRKDEEDKILDKRKDYYEKKRTSLEKRKRRGGTESSYHHPRERGRSRNEGEVKNDE